MHSCRSGNVSRVRRPCSNGEGPGDRAGRGSQLAPVPADLSPSAHVFLCAMASQNSTAPAAPANVIQNNVFDVVVELMATSLTTYYTPLLVLLGSIGNIISIYVFYATKLRLQSTSVYLSVLAVSDTLFLLNLLPPWLLAMGITDFFHRKGFCQIIVYGSYTSCCLSAWLVVAFTIERFVAVLYPLRRNSMCTVARARFIIGLLVFSSILVNLPLIQLASSSINDCNIDLNYMEHAARFNLADTLVSFSFPLGIIVFLNAWITVGVYRLECERRALQAEQAACPAESGSSGRQAGARALPPLRSQHRVTRMLLIVSTVFVVLNLPAYTMRLLAYAYDMSSGEYSGRWAALQQLALMFFNTNFGINFLLYCLSGQNFRRELCQSIPWLRNRVRRFDDLNLTCRNTGRASSVTISYVSTTEASSIIGESFEMASDGRRNRSKPYIERWTFDNSRVQRAQSQPPEEIEMRELRPTRTASVPEVPTQATQETQEETRKIPFVLFPFKRFMVPRNKKSESTGDLNG
ncbi:G-protein coupled receptor 183-A isoform X2 [Helicoverpa armigera]|uniref:G-protein coupled receptor 183-A isoform X2 n=1 Tax=Helicoverpa armigera TaxID=29058 RepID=UPI00211380DB|nr:G-protein coupled receptor 183-A isoform X2 [Helicoverpa armigera]